MKLSSFVFLAIIFRTSTGSSALGDCGHPPVFDNAQANAELNVESHPHGTEINYNCITGYVGRLRYKCDNGEWKKSNPRFACKLKPCESPGDVLHTTFRLVKGDDLVFGARIEYICDEGYKMVGTRSYRDCQVDGWTGLVPYCEVQTCPSVKEPKNGKIIMPGSFDLDQDFPFGSALQFECNSPELEIDGEKEIYCLANGTWSNPVPKCKELECKRPKIRNGQVRSAGKVFKYSQKLQYKCNRNYRPENLQQTTCSKFGWNPVPTCSPIVCRITQIEHGRFLTNKWMYAQDDKVNYTCDQNYRPVSSNTVQCQASGWSPNPSCIESFCWRPNIDVTLFTRRQRFRPMETIDYACRASSHQATSVCTRDGWSPPIRCPGPCSAPPNIDNGYFLNSDYSYQTNFDGRYQCDSQFRLQGDGRIKCIDGEWFITGSVPVCIAKGCGRPPTLINGRFYPNEEQYSERQQLTYICDEGYELHGEKVAYCHSGWPKAPICNDPRIPCPHPPEIDNGYLEPRDNTAWYHCQHGYIIERPRGIQCINGIWPNPPKCNPVPDPNLFCDHPPEILNGGTITINQREYRHGTRVTYKCHHLYVMEGERDIICFGGKWSAVPNCKAPCVILKEDLRKDKIHFPWSLQENLNIRHGERLIFGCPAGLHIELPAERFCDNGHLEIPTCLSEDVKTCAELQYFECPSCTPSEKCVQYHIKRIRIPSTDKSSVSLVAMNGRASAVFTVQNIHERSSSTLKFTIRESDNAMLNVAFNNAPGNIQYDNPEIGDYCFTFPIVNSIIFNVTFSGTFTIRFDRIRQALD